MRHRLALFLCMRLIRDLNYAIGYFNPSHLIFNTSMATGGEENFNPAHETFRKHSADLLTVIQDPEVLAWELYAENIISPAVRDAAVYVMHEKGARTSNLLMAVESQIAVDPGVFDVFLSVLAKRSPMSDLCGRMKDAYGKQADLDGSMKCCVVRTFKLHDSTTS